MKINSNSFIVLLLTILFASCENNQVNLSDNSPNVRPLSTREAQTVNSSNNFAFDIFTRLNEKEGSKNVFISPLSLSMALTMAYNGAGASTKEAMRQTLGFEPGSEDDLNESFRSVAGLLNNIDKTVNFQAANSIWHSQDLALQSNFVTANQKYFDAKVQGLDFTNPASKDIINKWVKEKTAGKIDEIVKEIRRDHLLFLLNAIYFKGNWTYTFDKKNTREAPFYLTDGSTRNVNMMELKNARYLLYQDATKTLVDLPYGNKQFSMTLLIPSGDSKLTDIAGDLNLANLNNWLSKADSTSLALYLPKFTMEYEVKLKETLSAMGMEEAFGNQADFSRMIEGITGGIAINEVTHKTFVDVNEEGTEAAAATSIDVILTSLPPSIRADKPFIFLIREKSSNTILFIGKLENPM
jgi:serpin B